MTAPARVEASGWGWRHAGRRAWAVRGLDLVIEPGERVLLLGASGAGKSTLLQGLAGVLGGAEEGESEGALTIEGVPAHTLRGHAGLVLQDPDAQVVLARVGDDVAFGCENLGIPREEIWRRVGAALDAVGLHLPLDHPTKALSGGQKQRLALAGALAMRPGLLLLDEPTANLDPGGAEDVRDSVARVAEATGSTLVVVEHRVQTWLDVVTRLVVLGADGVIADGDPRRVLEIEGPRLAAGGVWVPGIVPYPPPAPRARGTAVLEAVDLSVQRVRGGPIVAAGIDLRVHEGATLAVTGANGTGKSTLGLTVAGLLPAASGALEASPTLADGAGRAPIRWTSKQLLTRIGSVFQEPEHQLLARTVREELEVGPRALGVVEPRRIDELLERLRLAHLAAANPFTLSGGEKRRLTVAAALATRPRVLVLDEPTFGQDARTWRELVALLADVRDSGVGLVTVTHDAEVIRALHADRLELGGARDVVGDGGAA